jgi:glyoxylase-like metal-dependent hydrolase (beta-lactamase superfamily II)
MPAPWTDLGDGVHVRRSRAYEMNSVVLVRGGHAVVIDPGVLPTEMADLAGFVSGHAPKFENVALVFTHPHWDHVLGRDHFPAARTMAHVGFADDLERDAAKIEASAKDWIEGAGEPWPRPFAPFTPDVTVRGTIGIRLGPFDAIAYHVPGHCPSQLALFFPTHGVFVAADMLSDIEIPWLDGPPWVYRRTLKELHWVFEQEDVRLLVPGHGSVATGRTDGYRRLLRDLDYLLVLERRVADARSRGRSLEQTQAECGEMDYLGKDAAYAMNDVHRKNVEFTWKGLEERANGAPED